MNGIAPLLVAGIVAGIIALGAWLATALPDKMAEAIADVGRSIAYFFLHLLHGIWSGLAWIVDALETVFRKLAGLDTYWIVDSNTNTMVQQEGDMTLGLITSLLPLFQILVSVAFFLLVIFTILAIIRQQYKEKDGGNPYMVVFRMFKGLLMFAFISAACVVGLEASRIILKGIDSALRGGPAVSISGEVFKAMSYEGNRARADYSQTNAMDRLEYGYSEDLWDLLNRGDLDELFKNSQPPGHYEQRWNSNTGQYENVWVETPIPNINNGGFTWGFNDDTAETIDVVITAKDGEYDYLYKNWNIVEQFFIPTKFNWIIGFGGMFLCCSVFLNFTFGMIARIVELGALYLFSPLTLAFYPFDDGQQFNSAFVKPFYKKTISVFAPVLAMTAFFIIYPRVNAIQLHPPDQHMANLITNVIISLALFGMLPKIRNIIQNMLGADNMEEKGLGAALKDGWDKATAKNIRQGAKTAYQKTAKGVGYVTKKYKDYKARKDFMGKEGKHGFENTKLGQKLAANKEAKREQFKKEWNELVKNKYGGNEAAAIADGKHERKVMADHVADFKKAAKDSKPWKMASDAKKWTGEKADKIKNSPFGKGVAEWADILNPIDGVKGFLARSPLWNAFAGVGGWWEQSSMGKAFFELSDYSRYKGVLDLEKTLVERQKITDEFNAKINKPIEQGAIKRERRKTLHNDISEMSDLKTKDEDWWKEQQAAADARTKSTTDLFKVGNSKEHKTIQEAIKNATEHIADPDARQSQIDDLYRKVVGGSPYDILPTFGKDGDKILKARNIIAGEEADEKGNRNTANEALIKQNAEQNSTYQRLYGHAHDDGKLLGASAIDKKITKATQDLAQIEIDLNEYKALLNVNDADFNAILDEQSKLVGDNSVTKAVQQAFLRNDKKVLLNGVDVTPEGYGNWDGKFKDNKSANAWYTKYMHDQFATFDKFVDSKTSRGDVAVRDIVSKVHDRVDVQSAVKAGEEIIKSMIDTTKNLTVEGQQLYRSKFLAECLRSGDMVAFGDECMKAFNGLPSKIESEIVESITRRKKSDLRDVGQIFQQVMGNPNAEVRGDGNEKASAVLAKMFRVSFIDRVEESFGATATLADQMQTSAQAATENILSKFEGYINNQDSLFSKFLEPIQHLVMGKEMMNPNKPIEVIAKEIKAASAEFDREFANMSPSDKLLYQDFRADLNSLLGREQDNRRYRAEGDGIRAYLAELLGLPGDGALRALLGRGANQTGSTS